MLVIKTNLPEGTEKEIRRQAKQAGQHINAYLAPILNAVGEGRLTVGLIWREPSITSVAEVAAGSDTKQVSISDH